MGCLMVSYIGNQNFTTLSMWVLSLVVMQLPLFEGVLFSSFRARLRGTRDYSK